MVMTGVSIFERLYISEHYLRHSDAILWDFETAFMYIILLYLIFFSIVLVGYYYKIEDYLSIPDLDFESVIPNPNSLRRIAILYVLIGITFYTALVYLALDRNVLKLFTTTQPRSEIFSGMGIFTLGIRLIYLGYFLWLVAVIQRKNQLTIRHFIPVVPICTMFLLLGGRSRTIVILLITIIIFYYSRIYPLMEVRGGKIRFPNDRLHQSLKKFSIIIMGIISGFVILVSGTLRRGHRISDGTLKGYIIELLSFGIANAHLDYLLITISVVPEKIGFYYGTFFLRVPINYIPRIIWEDKPNMHFGTTLREVVFPEGAGGRPPGIIGRFYIEAGITSVIIGALVLGICLRMLYLVLRKNRNSPVVVLLYGIMLVALAAGGPSNGSLWVLLNHILLLSPVYFIYRFKH